MDSTISSHPSLFNSPLEAGLRTLIILDAFAPAAFDLRQLSLLDYFAVYAEDLELDERDRSFAEHTSLEDEAPSSLHPPIAARRGEYFVRRRVIEEGLVLMERAFLLDRVANEKGFSFRARDVSAAMVDLMESEYNSHLKGTARWIASVAQQEGYGPFFSRLSRGVDQWSEEINAGRGR